MFSKSILFNRKIREWIQVEKRVLMVPVISLSPISHRRFSKFFKLLTILKKKSGFLFPNKITQHLPKWSVGLVFCFQNWFVFISKNCRVMYNGWANGFFTLIKSLAFGIKKEGYIELCCYLTSLCYREKGTSLLGLAEAVHGALTQGCSPSLSFRV